MALSNISQRRKILFSGVIAWVISLVSSLNIYLLAMDGDYTQFKFGVVLTALLTSIISGLKDLLAFLAESPRDVAPVPEKKPSQVLIDDPFDQPINESDIGIVD